MPEVHNGYIHTTIHDFKTHISRYIRLLEAGEYRGVLLRRGKTIIGYFLTHEGRKTWESKHGPRDDTADMLAAIRKQRKEERRKFLRKLVSST